MKTPVIETPRLILRPLSVSDAKDAFYTWTNDTRVTKYMIYTTHKNVDETREWLEKTEKGIESDNYDWGFVLKETGKLIGSGGAYLAMENVYSIGYNLCYDLWNKGYTSEAVAAIVDFLKSIGAKKIVSEHAVENIYSGKVMEKVGLHYVKDDDYKCIDGRVFKAKYYEMNL